MVYGVTTYRLDELKYDEFKPLGEGGAAEIFRCTTSDGSGLILKLYNDETRSKVDFEALRAMIAFPGQLDAEEREHLLKICAWPQALVVDKGGAEVGLVMPEAPPRFFLTREGKTEPRHFSRAAVSQDKATKQGYEYFDFPEKIALLGHLLAGLIFLHEHKIVIGDLQWNNILITGPRPSAGEVIADVHFLDCDSFILGGVKAQPLMDPISWKPQFATDGFSATTDMYKFALFVVRCLSERTNQDSIAFAEYRELLPSDDFQIINQLLTSPSPSFGAQQLASMARAWQLSVRADGKRFRRTDEFTRQAWSPELRAKHMATVSAGMSTPTAAKPHQGPPTYSRPGVGGGGTVPPSSISTPSYAAATGGGGGGKSNAKWWWIAAAAIVLLIFIIIAVNDNSSSRSSGTYTTPYRPTTTTAFVASTTVPAFTPPPAPFTPASAPTRTYTGNALRDAQAGDCINRVVGASNGDGTSSVTVSAATCGTSYATHEVVSVVSDVDSCGSLLWVRSPDPYPIVLCLQDD